jgi:dTDP-L-rhamnose 4-epimerase
VSKLCLETTALRLGAARGIDTTMLRFALTFGRRQSATNPYCGIIALFCQRMLRGKPVLIYEDGAQSRDFIHVTDVARAIVQVAGDAGCHGRSLNIGTGKGTAVADVLATLAGLLEVDAEMWMPGWYRPGDVRHLITDASRLREHGWRPEVDLVDGLRDYVEWMRDRPLAPDPFDEGFATMRDGGVVRCRDLQEAAAR